MQSIAQRRIKALASNTKMVYFVAQYAPPTPGALVFATALEYKYFPPGTNKNDPFLGGSF